MDLAGLRLMEAWNSTHRRLPAGPEQVSDAAAGERSSRAPHTKAMGCLRGLTRMMLPSLLLLRSVHLGASSSYWEANPDQHSLHFTNPTVLSPCKPRGFHLLQQALSRKDNPRANQSDHRIMGTARLEKTSQSIPTQALGAILKAL